MCNFILTKYIYPLEEKQVVSRHLQLFFDNPRTDDEIRIIKDYIEVSTNPVNHAEEWGPFIAKNREEAGVTDPKLRVANFRGLLEDFKARKDSKYIQHFFEEHKSDMDENPIDVLVRMIVVLRYNDEGEIERLEQIKTEMKPGSFFMLDEEHPLVRNQNNAITLGSLISFLIAQSEYSLSNGFLLPELGDLLDVPRLDKQLNRSLFYACLYYAGSHKRTDLDLFIDFDLSSNKIIEYGDMIDNLLDDHTQSENNFKTLLYIGNEMEKIRNARDDDNMLVVIVSLIEMLIAHKPNANRFNVEDSITKQFILKVSTLMYMENPQQDLNNLKNNLKKIYDLRSNISHGDFQAIELCKNKLGEDEYFEEIIFIAGDILRVILKKFIQENNFIRFFKDN